MAELLRIKGELLLMEVQPNAAVAAEDHFQQALTGRAAREPYPGKLRCTTSLVRLWREPARSDGTRELLSSVYDRFTEGFATADLRAAKALIEDLS